MKKWKIAFGTAAFIAVVLAAALVWQNHQIKEDLLRAYILEHASLEQALAIALDEYDSTGDARQLSADLVIAYGQSQVVMQPADEPLADGPGRAEDRRCESWESHCSVLSETWPCGPHSPPGRRDERA